MKQYCITDDLSVVIRAAARGATMIQIRAKDLPTRALLALVKSAVAQPGAIVLVNGRIDIALACGAAGVHLPGNAIAPHSIRTITPSGFLIGVSCHTVEELRRAESEGANFAVYGPVYATGGKAPIGLDAFRDGASAVAMPVYALGGITLQNAPACLEAGAAGIAGISCFGGRLP